MMNKTLATAAALLLMVLGLRAQTVQYQENSTGDGLVSLSIAGDSMNWLVRTDGSQYAPVTERYAWGKVLRLPGGVSCTVKRQTDKRLGDLVETYTLKNTTTKPVRLNETSICTPWNDNYPDAETCMALRCNAHVWTGGANTYVCALRMNGQGPHLGLMLTEGEISDYEVLERGPKTAGSNFRGVLALCLPDTTLMPGQSLRIAWRLFSHKGKDDFEAQLLKRGGVVVSADRYVCPVGDTIRVTVRTAKDAKTVLHPVTTLGDQRIPITYNKGKRTFAEVRGISSPGQLLARRVQFIIDHQQMLDTADVRYGAFMVYDNEGDSILTHYTRSDLDEGRERVGMGILLAACLQSEKLKVNSEKFATAVQRYAEFLRTKLQDQNYKTRSSLVKASKNRGYNYAWIADFYFRMYELTGNRQYARDGYGTLRALYRQFGHEFYCIDYPVTVGLSALGRAGLTAERDTLLADFRQTGDLFVRNGLHFPKFEVNYEQSIIAPAVQFLSELYLATRDQHYLNGARLLMPALDAFSHRQPSCYMNDIGLRHWDGYWFGKRQTYGDTYPHYWSAITAAAFHYYALATGLTEYQRRAENIVLNNLVSFSEDGRATCAILRPLRVNGQTAYYRDAYANDQDWALVFYLAICNAEKPRLHAPTTFEYQNPVAAGIDTLGLRDCHIFRDGASWYMTGTAYPFWRRQETSGQPLNAGVPLYRSSDLLHWQFVDYVVRRPTADKWYYRNFWAPEIRKIRGRYYCTFNCANPQAGYTGIFCGYAVSDSLCGPYRVVTDGEPLSQGNDLTLFEDTDGTVWAFWNRGADVGILQSRIDLDAGHLLDQPRVVIPAGAKGEWDSIGIEGSCVFRRGGLYYLLYSSWTRGYEIGCATAPSITGPWTKGAGNPVYGAQDPEICAKRGLVAERVEDSPFTQVGHCQVFLGPTGDYWLSCHGNLASNPEHPLPVIDPLRFGPDGQLLRTIPSFTPQTVPVGPCAP